MSVLLTSVDSTSKQQFSQLLIDLQTVKAYLVKMPGENLQSARYLPTFYNENFLTGCVSYTRGLTKSTTRLEALLKVIVTPVVSLSKSKEEHC